MEEEMEKRMTLVPTTMNDPRTGETMYVQMRRPRLIRELCRSTKLFIELVWLGNRVSCSWDVVKCLWSFQHDLACWKAARAAPKTEKQK